MSKLDYALKMQRKASEEAVEAAAKKLWGGKRKTKKTRLTHF